MALIRFRGRRVSSSQHWAYRASSTLDAFPDLAGRESVANPCGIGTIPSIATRRAKSPPLGRLAYVGGLVRPLT
jgi:hypothetical protein